VSDFERECAFAHRTFEACHLCIVHTADVTTKVGSASERSTETHEGTSTEQWERHGMSGLPAPWPSRDERAQRSGVSAVLLTCIARRYVLDLLHSLLSPKLCLSALRLRQRQFPLLLPPARSSWARREGRNRVDGGGQQRRSVHPVRWRLQFGARIKSAFPFVVRGDSWLGLPAGLGWAGLGWAEATQGAPLARGGRQGRATSAQHTTHTHPPASPFLSLPFRSAPAASRASPCLGRRAASKSR
jgi:hypothetical protein